MSLGTLHNLSSFSEGFFEKLPVHTKGYRKLLVSVTILRILIRLEFITQ
jgi:hypothetical protein